MKNIFTKRNILIALLLVLFHAGVYLAFQAPDPNEALKQTISENFMITGASSDVSMYPKPLSGQHQVVLTPISQKDEQSYEIELIIGKAFTVDCNSHKLMGSINDKTVDGFGYAYFTAETTGQLISTLMYCADSPMKSEFLSISKKIAYNSKLPVVVYVPDGYQFGYRIWSRGQEVMVK